MTRAREALVPAAALVVVTAALAVLAVLRAPLPLPVVAHLGSASVRIATLQATAAVIVPPALVAVLAVLHAAGRSRGVVIAAAGAASPIVLFVVARLNGLEDAMALVLVYACCPGGVLLRSLHRTGGEPAPLRWWSVLGVVPWGVVAFTQIGATLAGTGPSAAVRVLTLVVLAASVLEFVIVYRRRDRPVSAPGGLLLVAAPGVLLAAIVVLAVR